MVDMVGVMVIVLTNLSTGEIEHVEPARVFNKSWQCDTYLTNKKYDDFLKADFIHYFTTHKEYAQPGYSLSARCYLKPREYTA